MTKIIVVVLALAFSAGAQAGEKFFTSAEQCEAAVRAGQAEFYVPATRNPRRVEELQKSPEAQFIRFDAPTCIDGVVAFAEGGRATSRKWVVQRAGDGYFGRKAADGSVLGQGWMDHCGNEVFGLKTVVVSTTPRVAAQTAPAASGVEYRPVQRQQAPTPAPVQVVQQPVYTGGPQQAVGCPGGMVHVGNGICQPMGFGGGFGGYVAPGGLQYGLSGGVSMLNGIDMSNRQVTYTVDGRAYDNNKNNGDRIFAPTDASVNNSGNTSVYAPTTTRQVVLGNPPANIPALPNPGPVYGGNVFPNQPGPVLSNPGGGLISTRFP